MTTTTQTTATINALAAAEQQLASQQVSQLPVEQREVVGLVFYHGWTQAKIAELFGVDERTIRRRWSSACQKVRELVGGIPG